MTSLGVRMKGQPRLYYGWVVVATTAVGQLLGSIPIAVFAFGTFFPSFVRQFHTSRAMISLAFTIHNLISGMLAVIVGFLCDRFGVRKVILPGLAMLGVVLLSAEAIGAKVWQLYVFYAALGIVAPATNSVPYGLVVSRWFNRQRGLALGIMMAGLGGGAIVMPLLAQRLIASFGWRAAFAIVGGVVLLLPLPIVATWLKETPEQMDVLPDAASATSASNFARASSEGMAWRDIWHSGTFWLMIATFVLVAASVHACIIHMPELLADRGASMKAAAAATSALGLAVLLGRIGTGYLLDRYFGPHVALFIFASAGFGIALLWTGNTGLPTLVGASLVGLGFGAEVDVIAYLIGRYFGLRSLGTAFGFAFGAFVLAGGLGPLMMGLAFDRTGSYRVALLCFSLATLAAAALVGRMGPYRYTVVRKVENEIPVNAAKAQ